MKKIDIPDKEKKIIREWLNDWNNKIDFHILLKEHNINLSEELTKDFITAKPYLVQLALKKQKTKNQHYVPQLYLKRFLNNDNKLEVFDNKNLIWLKPKPTNRVCSSDFFYSIRDWKEDLIAEMLEDIFYQYESSFLKIYNWLVEEIMNWQKISDKNHYNLCEFISSLWIRGKYFREEMNSSQEEITKKLIKMNFIHNKEKYKSLENMVLNEEYNINFPNSLHIDFMNPDKINEFARWFAIKKIRIYISDWSVNFITSDNPVTSITPVNNHFLRWNHFCDRIHYFALTPNILIEFIPPESPWKKIKRKKIGKDDIIYFNFIRSRNAKYLYAKNKLDFDEDDFLKIQIERFGDLQKLFKDFKKTDKDIIDDTIRKINEVWLDWKDFILNFLKDKRWKQ